MQRPVGPLLIVPVIFFLDRLSKNIVLRCLSEGESFFAIPGILRITRVNNTGAAFGILKNSEKLLFAVAVFFVIYFTILLVRKLFFSEEIRKPRVIEYAWALVLAGALGNLTDRFFYGHVIDFLDFQVWPVFNIADTSICVGVFLAAIYFLKMEKS